MRWIAGWSIVLAAAAVWAGGTGPATRLTVAEPEFRDPEIVVAKSTPPRLEIVFVRDMPTPGWKFSVDAVEVDEASSRITARISDIPPDGAVAQMITPTKCRVPLGKLSPGAYALELWVRRGETGPHALKQALVVHAR